MKRFVQKFISLLTLLSAEVILLWTVFFGCMLLFVVMANTVFTREDNRFDTALFQFAENHTSPEFTRLMMTVSYFASAEYLLIVPALVVLVFSFFRNMRWYGLKILLISFTSTMLNQLMKHIFDRPRPETAMFEETGFSFPSGHAMIGGSFYGLLIYIVWKTVKNPFWKWCFIILLTLLLLLIGYSRIYLNVHYATDVLAGYAIGVLWLIVSVYLLKKLEKIYLAKFGDSVKR